MESFFRSITYIDYYENGTRLQVAGFIRWKMQGKLHTVEIQIKMKDVPIPKGSYSFIEKKSGRVFREFALDRGEAYFYEQYMSWKQNDDCYIHSNGQDWNLQELKELTVDLGQGKKLVARLELPLKKETKKAYISVEAAGNTETYNEVNLLEKKENAGNIQIKNLDSDYKDIKNIIDKNIDIDNNYKVSSESGERIESEENSQKEINSLDLQEPEIIQPLHEDKWTQLSSKYSRVHPFPAGQTFLSIKPEDFVILQKGYQKLVHNSFLLHGFYNYRHMILGKLMETEEAPYYLGVPGVYYDREKQAAQMFGFVGFESTETPVQNGSFGYYMMEVEI